MSLWPFVTKSRLHREVTAAAETYRLASEEAQAHALEAEEEAFAAASELIKAIGCEMEGEKSLEIHVTLSRHLAATSSDEVVARFLAKEIVREIRCNKPAA